MTASGGIFAHLFRRAHLELVETIGCPDCDLLQQIPRLPPGGKARCAQCGETLFTQRADPLNRLLALTVAAAVAFIIANTSPLMGLSAVGRESSTTIIGGAHEMWLQGSQITAVIVAFCAVIAPAGHILFLLVVLIRRWRARRLTTR